MSTAAGTGASADTLSAAGTAQMLRSLEALGRTPGAQLEPGWPRFLGEKCFKNRG